MCILCFSMVHWVFLHSSGFLITGLYFGLLYSLLKCSTEGKFMNVVVFFLYPKGYLEGMFLSLFPYHSRVFCGLMILLFPQPIMVYWLSFIVLEIMLETCCLCLVKPCRKDLESFPASVMTADLVELVTLDRSL